MIFKRSLICALLTGSLSLSATNSVNTPTELTISNKQKLQRKGFVKKDPFHLKYPALTAVAARDWDKEEMTSGGFFLNLGIYFLMPSYLHQSDLYYFNGYDLEIGNYFRFAKVMDGGLGIGMRATWLSIGTSLGEDEFTAMLATQISALRIGPMASYALNDKMSIDGFYQIGGNYTFLVGGGEDIDTFASFFGLTHEIGVMFRFKMFNGGIGYRFGSLNCLSYWVDADDYTEFMNEYYGRFPSSNLKVMAGFKF